ncbi:transmembrane 220 family protein [Hymenobacter sp. B1770]|uniref:transmembrane 220 family protein n=1 Tax=Hymenobacter sp. B1770 TaxID=1718788 RepID=UPI003CEAFE4C
MRYVFWTLALLLVVFAALQLNDPDPALWVALYLVPAAVMAWVASGAAVSPWLPWGLTVVYVGLAIWWWPSRFDGVTGPMSPQTTVEEGREALGLLICAACLALAGRYAHRRSAAGSKVAV